MTKLAFKPLPPFAEVFNRLSLSDTSPSGLIWKNPHPMAKSIKSGDIAGCQAKDNYWVVRLNGSVYKAHRLVYFLRNGEDPGNLMVDHVNGNPAENTELRLVDVCLNGANRKKTAFKSGKNPLSRFKGVTYSRNKKGLKKWMAYIQVNKKSKTLGYFLTEQEAALAYNKAASQFWGPYARLNYLEEA